MVGEVIYIIDLHVLIMLHYGKSCETMPVCSPFFGRILESSTYITGDIDAGCSKFGKSKGMGLR